MVARPHVVSCIHSFANALMQWVEAPGGTTINVPFTIAGCTKYTVISRNLRFWMEVPDDDPVPLYNNVIGRWLQWASIEDAIVARNQCTKGSEVVPHPPPRGHAQDRSGRLTKQLHWRTWRINTKVEGIRCNPRISGMNGLYGVEDLGTF